jgi:SAM-dependent methyltransferase/putative flippase GtrA
MAASYDATFTDSGVGRVLRRLAWKRMEHSFAGCRRVLELGCGTGEDALHLARSGFQVLATDASPQMLQVARRKALADGCGERVELRCVAMEDLGTALAGQSFDAVLSNFGAINCVRDLPALAATLAERVAPGGKLLWVVMGRTVPWEWGWYLAHGEWRKAWRRLAPHGVSWRGLTISYPSPATLRQLLEPWFTTDRIAPLGLTLPPSYAAAWLDHSPRALATLTSLESLAQRCAPLAYLSDHYIIEATRRNGPGDRPSQPQSGQTTRRQRESTAGTRRQGGVVRLIDALMAYARAHSRELVRYALVGAALALLNLALLFCFRNGLHLPDPVALTLMYGLGALAHFASHRRITYAAPAEPRRQVPRYLLMLAWNFAVLQAVVALATRASLSPYFAVIAVTGLTMVSNFLAMTHTVFAKRVRS